VIFLSKCITIAVQLYRLYVKYGQILHFLYNGYKQYSRLNRLMSNENKGLASADEETKERVAKKGGEARAQDKEGLSEAGRKGGEQ
jgi:hypothetical protein